MCVCACDSSGEKRKNYVKIVKQKIKNNLNGISVLEVQILNLGPIHTFTPGPIFIPKKMQPAESSFLMGSNAQYSYS